MSSLPVNLHTGGPRQVGFYMFVKALTNIDCVNQSFQVKYYLYITWPPTEEEYRQFLKDSSYVPESMPEVHLHNMMEDHEPETKIHLLKSGGTNIWGETLRFPKDTVFFATLRMYNDTCSTEFDVRAFPFDSQDLHMIFKMRENSQKFIFVPSLLYFPSRTSVDIEMGTLARDAIYEMHPPVVEFNACDAEYRSQSDPQATNAWATAIVTFKITRKWEGYVWRVFLFASMLDTMNLAIFFLDPADFGTRLSIIVTVLVAMAAFQFVVWSSMPTVPYLSFADKFIIASYGFIFAVFAYSCFASLGFDVNQDHLVGQIFAIAWGAKQLFFAIYSVKLEFDSRVNRKLCYTEINDRKVQRGQGIQRLISTPKDYQKFNCNRTIFDDYTFPSFFKIDTPDFLPSTFREGAIT